ncbi:MAG: enoyl-CoA hydratase [Rhodovarius sp.]|nr:enoyl-CoA hydratase [Rhodovarius sp.]MCX7933368.1 enoyl-CoA hydratase [Rhodovarius sp.]
MIETDFAGPIARITIRNEAKLNSLGSAALEALAEAFRAVPEAARAVVLTGAGGRAFIGGADIREMAALPSPEAARAFILRIHRLCRAIRDCPKPVIARIEGYCLGAGLEIAAACDLRIAAPSARFGMPEVRIGMPSVVEAALLPGLIGWGRTRRLLLLGETIGAEEAERWGLIERLAEDLDAAVAECCALIMEAGPEAIRAQKRLIRAWEDLPVSAAIAAGIDAYEEAWRGEEPRRMTAAFLARRRRG